MVLKGESISENKKAESLTITTRPRKCSRFTLGDPGAINRIRNGNVLSSEYRRGVERKVLGESSGGEKSDGGDGLHCGGSCGKVGGWQVFLIYVSARN